MKNQYFGDNKDLFKYDLILQIIKAGVVAHFTFIPMLTSSTSINKSAKSEGEQRDRSKAKAGWKNNDLRVFLDKFQNKDKRDIRELAGFFKEQGIEITIYCGKDKYFSHTRREGYFKQIRNELLRKSLVFVDPDIGLAPKGKTKREHVKYCEVKSLYDRMDKSSILMIFQDLSRKKCDEYLAQTSARIKNEVRTEQPIYIHDKKTLFLFLTRENKTLRESLGKEISKYGEAYKLKVGNV